jgi:epsilon-lactone hydrolase
VHINSPPWVRQAARHGRPQPQRISVQAELLRLALRLLKRSQRRRSLPVATVRRRLKHIERFVPRPPADTQTTVIDGGGVNTVRVVVREARSDRCVLYFHGGAYAVGTAALLQDFTWRIGAAARACVLYFDYRLAPEHPFPAALEDACSAYRWLVEHVGDASRVVLAGDSSGAGLALAVMLSLKAAGEPMPAGAALLCPSVDMSGGMLTSTTRPHPMDEIWRAAQSYLAGHSIEDPLVSPLRGDLTGLPPLLVQGATGDRARPEAEELAGRARDDGVDVRLELYPVDTHVFHIFWSFLPEAVDALARAGEFVRDALPAEGAASSRTG